MVFCKYTYVFVLGKILMAFLANSRSLFIKNTYFCNIEVRLMTAPGTNCPGQIVFCNGMMYFPDRKIPRTFWKTALLLNCNER